MRLIRLSAIGEQPVVGNGDDQRIHPLPQRLAALLRHGLAGGVPSKVKGMVTTADGERTDSSWRSPR